MCASLVSEWLDGTYFYSVFKGLSLIGQCLMNMNILAPKIGALQMDHKNKMAIFIKNCSNSLDYISVMETISLNKTA
jgi:hypothetical protein